jgi:hypothetical protein
MRSGRSDEQHQPPCPRHSASAQAEAARHQGALQLRMQMRAVLRHAATAATTATEVSHSEDLHSRSRPHFHSHEGAVMARHFCKGGGGAYVDTDCKDCMRRLDHPEEFPLTEPGDDGGGGGMTVEQAAAAGAAAGVAEVASSPRQAHTPTSEE